MELFDCPNCGRGAWKTYEIKNGLCPFCQDYEFEEDEKCMYEDQKCKHGNISNECDECIREYEYLKKLQWEENMNNLYDYDDGFCDGFTKI